MVAKYDKIIIGAGLYGLYSALFCVGGVKENMSQFWNVIKLHFGGLPILTKPGCIKVTITPAQYLRQ